MNNVLAILLAGGAGERLAPLTRHTAKPSIPFGGAYRVIDFTLSNCLNSGVRRVFVLTQYKSLELTRHIREGWSIFSGAVNEFIEVIPPMKRIHEDWYRGTADAVYQNLESILREAPELTLVLSGDHIYKMDYHELISWHRSHKADITLATIQIPPAEAPRFGVLEIDRSWLVKGFEEKPKHGNPVRSVFNPQMVSASMGIYVFNTRVLKKALLADAARESSAHDFGRNILPSCIADHRVVAWDFRDPNNESARYWRDVGTLDAYYESNMDLLSPHPECDLYDDAWPMRTHMVQQPPARFVFSADDRRAGVAIDSIVSAGCVIEGGRLTRSILSPGVRVRGYCEIDGSVLMSNCDIGRYSRIRNAIIPPDVVIPENSTIGFNREEDIRNGYTVTAENVVVVPPPEPDFGEAEPERPRRRKAGSGI